MAEAFIYDAVRTPRGKGKADGSLHSIKPVSLVTGLIGAVLERNNRLPPALIDDVVLGCVTPVGDQGADIAKTAAIVAGLPDTVAGVQVNRFCASGLEAVNMAAQKVRSGFEDFVLAGGVESMSRAAMGSDGGAWAMDPMTNYDTRFVPQGIGADLIATLEGWSRTTNELLSDIFHKVKDIILDSITEKSTATARIDHFALLVHHVVVFQQPLADAVVVLFDLLLRPLD
jgi:acetyl-CoA C-acetyltransferase